MGNKLRSADLLVKAITETLGALDELKDHPEKVLKKMLEQINQNFPNRALEQDKCIYRSVVGFLGSVALFSVLGAIYIVTKDPSKTINVPDIITALSSAAIVALAGLLSPMPQRS